MAKKKTLTLAALAGMALGMATPYNAQAQDNTAAGKSSDVKCYGINGCAQHASCGASSKILNFTTVSERECQQSKGIVIEEVEGKKVAKQL